MASQKELREQLATCSRIFAMQGLIGLFGHVSVYNPETKTVLVTPGSGSDKASFQPSDMISMDLTGKPIDRTMPPPVEWPIHTALHAARVDALAVAHLHTPYATLFAIARREFHPVTLQGTIFGEGVPLYKEAHLVTTPQRGDALLMTIGDHRAVLMRGHGVVVAGKSLPEVLFASLILEDDAKKTMQAAALGPVEHFTAEECKTFNAEIDFERRANRAWEYFSKIEKNWDRQSGTGKIELFP
ncbi:MAG: class II aldolase/adducin family protein [Deltaproteobacteria bacterium]|nr:class II aldolase/adducin family protein [Deltaproteobacteria bacterium]